jgi:hypothetical protein
VKKVDTVQESTDEVAQSLLLRAQTLANVLKFELQLEKKRRTSCNLTLLTEIPLRTDPLFRQGHDALKAQLSHSLSNQPHDNASRRLFCFMHGDFVMPSGVDIDHTYPYTRIRNNQQRLLSFLNAKENMEFKKIFLKEQGIFYYFREDTHGLVKGSHFFYHSCYSAIDNLFLLCHSCNLHKGTIDPLVWFQKEEGYFGEPFLEAMDYAGGLHEGVLFDRVYKIYPQDPDLTFDDGTRIILPVKDSIGLGKFISRWFLERFNLVFEENKEFYNANYSVLQKHFETIRFFILSGQRIKAQKAHLRLMGQMTMLSILQRELVGFKLKQTSSGSETSSDDAEGRENNISFFESKIGEFKADLYAIIKIRDCIKDWYGDKELAKEIRKYCQEYQKQDATLLSRWETIFCQFQLFIEKYFKSQHSTPPPDELKQKIHELCQECSIAEKARREEEARKIAEEKAREEEVARKIAEEKARIAEEKAREEEVARKIAEEKARTADEEIQELKKQLRQMQLQQNSQSSQQSMAMSKFYSTPSSKDETVKEAPHEADDHSDDHDPMDFSSVATSPPKI